MRLLRPLFLVLSLPLLLPCACQSRGQDRAAAEAPRDQPSPDLSGVLWRGMTHEQAREALAVSNWPPAFVFNLHGGVDMIRKSPRYPRHDVYLHVRFSGDDSLIDGWNVTPAQENQLRGGGAIRAALSGGGG